jgi:hypothetical protein
MSINGFTQDALDAYQDSTPFITLDGMDLFMVLDERVGKSYHKDLFYGPVSLKGRWLE